MSHKRKTDVLNRKWAQYQSQRMIERSRAVIYIDEDKNPIKTVRNLNFSVGTIAVIGPAILLEGGYVEQVIHMEIGTERSYPYRRSEGYNGKKIITSERKRYVASPNPAELTRFLPALEKIMLELAWEGIEGRKYDVWEIDKKVVVPQSVRFSVNWTDESMVAVLLQSELIRKKKGLAEDMRCAAEWVDKRLSTCNMEFSTDKEIMFEIDRNWSGLHKIDGWYDRRTRTLLPHWYALILMELSQKKSLTMFKRLLFLWGVDEKMVLAWGSFLKKENVPIFSEKTWISSVPMSKKQGFLKRSIEFDGFWLPKEHVLCDVTPVEFCRTNNDDSYEQDNYHEEDGEDDDIPF